MAKVKFIALHEDTGEIVEITQNKNNRKRGRDFFMTDQASAESISADKDLNGTDLRVLWFLLSKIGYDNVAIVTQAFISEKIGSQHSLVSSSIKKLCEKEYIKKVSVNGSNGYWVNSEFATKGRNKQNDTA